jgi:hypothetical protein
MNSKISKSLLLCAVLLAGPAVAGCGEMQGTCLVISADEQREVGCNVTVCANVYSYWSQWEIGEEGSVNVEHANDKTSIKLDQEPGFAVHPAIVKDGLTCYTSANLEKTYCAKDIAL